MNFPADAMEMLRQNSRTFYIPICQLPATLLRAVGSAYLCFRAIDEIEDHRDLPIRIKCDQLSQISDHIRQSSAHTVVHGFPECDIVLPEVTQRLPEWLGLAPADVSRRIAAAVSKMAAAMSGWAETGWRIENEQDLDRYTYDVAGSVGVLLCELWEWHDGTLSDRTGAAALGRGLQAVNILNNRADDLSRDVDFLPPGWQLNDLEQYALARLKHGTRYVDALADGPAKRFSQLPLALAYATIDSLSKRHRSLSRQEVMSLTTELCERHRDRGA